MGTSLTLIGLLLAYAPNSLAQSSSVKIETQNKSTLKIEKPAGSTTSDSTNDIDNKITDARLRAALGSKSKWSFKSRMNYAGGSLAMPFHKITPNIRNNGSMESMSALTGDVGVNYRLSPSDSISMGTGILMVAPLHGDPSKSVSDERNDRNETQSRYQVSSPFIEWQKGYLMWDTMMMTSVKYMHSTNSDAVDLMKSFGNIFIFQHVSKNIGTSRWTVGASGLMMKSFYSGQITDPKLRAAQTMGILKRHEYVLGVVPSLQYAITERFSLRSDFVYANFIKFEDDDSFTHDDPFQSVGLGVSITRDIYLYPNVQFSVKDIHSDRSNVALMANINLF
ncbi:hypothetical protein [Bdellovibrio sp. HCB209]|uniref:hypothetical protein n=1 Tax=Bdellovibrio sp. HCB209 TaxID=3394354 RepID=UPI0039B5C8F9